jgi:phosphatidylcholine synthase
VAFYLCVLETPPWANAFIIIVLCILVFVPIRYVYPSRSTRYRAITNGLGIVWAILIAWLLYTLPQPSRALAFASLFYPFYYVFLSLYLNWRREPFAAPTRRAP